MKWISLLVSLIFCFSVEAQNTAWLESINNKVRKANTSSIPVTGASGTDLASASVPLYIFRDSRNNFFYWADEGTGSIKRVPIGGGAIQDVVTGISGAGIDPRGIYLDITNSILYWAETAPGATDRIRKVNISGGLPKLASTGTDVITGIGIVRGIVLDTLANTIYYADAGPLGPGKGIYRGSLPSTPMTATATTVISNTPTTQPNDLAIDNTGNFVYWCDYANPGGMIQRAPTNAGGYPVAPTLVYSGVPVRGISYDAFNNFIYWVEPLSLTIKRGNTASVPILSPQDVVTGINNYPRDVSEQSCSQPVATVPGDVSYCSGTTVPSGTLTFSATTTSTFAWTNSNPSIGLGASGSGSTLPTFTTTNSGTATITVTPTSTSDGCVGTATTFHITVRPPAAIAITPAGPAALCNGNVLTLTASGPCDNYPFSGAMTGAQEVPPTTSTATVTFNGMFNPANNMMTLGITFSGLSSNTTGAHIHRAAVGVNGPIIVDLAGLGFPLGVTSGTFTATFAFPAGDVASFTANNTYINIHTQTLPGGEVRGQIMPCVPTYTWSTGPVTRTIVVSSPGTYSVTGSDQFGCSGSASILVTAGVAITGPATTCMGTPIDLTGIPNDSGPGVTWSTSDPTKATVSPSGVVTPVSGGIVTISYYYPASGCTNTATKMITINSGPTATVTGTTAACRFSTSPNILFTGANGTAPYTFTYRINGGPTQTVSSSGSQSTATVAVPTGTPGTYGYQLVSVSDNNLCSQVQGGAATVTVRDNPQAGISPSKTVCQGGTATITFTGFNTTGPYTILYTINNGATQTVTANPATTISAPTGTPGIFAYTLSSVTDNFGCSALAFGTATITVKDPPNSNAGPDQIICAPQSTTTLAGSALAGTQTGTWSIVSGPDMSPTQIANTSSPTTQFTAFAKGTYILRWTIGNPPCSPSSDDVQLIFNPQVAGDILGASNTTICAGSNTTVDTDLSGTGPFTTVFNITLTSGSGASSVYTSTSPTGGITGISVPAANLTNTGATDASYVITWVKLTDANACSVTSPSPFLTGQVIITVEPVPTIAAVADRPNLCNGSSVAITVSNPNGVGGLYDKSVSYPAGLNHTGAAVATNQSYGTFNEVLTNTTAGPLTATYTFTPKGPGSQHCVGTSTSITVVVQPNPTISCPGNVVTTTTAVTCDRVVNGIAPTIFNPGGCNNGTSSITYTIGGATTVTNGITNASGTTFNRGLSTVTYKITDPQGNVATCSFTVTVNDATAPTINCPSPAAQAANATCTYAAPDARFDPTVATDNCPNPILSYSFAGATTSTTVTSTTLAGVFFNKGTTTVTWRLTDASGNVSTCTFNVVVNDVTPPVITCPFTATGTTVSTTTSNPCTYPVVDNRFDATATDNCGVVTRTYTLSGATTATGGGTIQGRVLNKGTTIITWTATDATPNTSTCSFPVTVVDVVPPSITCVGSKVTSTDPNQCSYRVKNNELDATITDNCVGPDPAIIQTWTTSGTTTLTGSGTLSGTVFNKGVTTVVMKATDAAGNSSTCSFSITVNDTQAPAITCTTDKTVPTDPNVCTYTHPFGNLTWDASVTDNCGVVVLAFTLSGATTNTLGQSTLEGQVFNKGVTTVTYVAKDVAGNVSTCTFTVTVFDNQVPVATCTSTVNRNTNNNLCTWVSPNSNIDAVASDNCPFTVTYTITGATTATVVGTLSGTIFNKGTTNVGVTVTDGTFTSTCSFQVIVSDNQAPTITCPSSVVKSANATCTYVASGGEFDPVISENCPGAFKGFTLSGATVGAIVSATSLNGQAFNKGVTTVVWKVTDAAGNSASCSFTVTVNDVTPPTVTGVVTQTLNTGAGAGCQVAMPDYTGYIRSLAFDNCGTATGTLTIIQNAPNAPGTPVIGYGGTRVLVFTVFDQAGNTITVTMDLLLRDLTQPTALCKPATLFLGSNGTVSVTVADVNNGSFDNCSAVTMFVSPTSFSCANTATTQTVFLTVIDASGNVATCTSNVTVKDNIKPVVTCPGDQTLFKNAIACTTVIPDYTGVATATDNCSPAVTKTQSPAAGTIIAASVTQTTVTITATDGSGNTATCSFTVFHVDNIKPTFTSCPSNFTISSNTATANGGGNTTTCAQIGTWPTPTATDNCVSNGAPVITSTHAPGSSFAFGTTTVTYTATDWAGNTNTCVFTVTVVDNTKPNITCGGTITASTAGANCTATINLSAPIVSDNCGVLTVTSNHPSTQYGLGTSTVVWTATDINGNTSTCSQLVVITDGGKPVMNCPAPATIAPNTINCVASYNVAAPTVTDCSSFTVTYAITGAGATGPVTGTGAVGTRNFNVGITTITYTALDAAGNTQTCATTVEVVNNLTGIVSGTTTVVQNSSSTSAVVFTASGGTPQYVFTYSLSINGGPANVYTVTTVSSNPSTSVAQSNAVLGVYVYRLLSVTDLYGCSGAIVPNGNIATVTVVSGPPDFTPTVDIASLSFASAGTSRDFIVNINEISQLSPSLGQVVFRLVKPTAFTITFGTVNGTSNVFGPTPNNNGDWTFTQDAFFITATLKPSAVIPANSFSRVGFNITRNVGVAANTSQNLTVTIVNGSGGDNNSNNNTSNTVVTAQ